MGRPSNINLLHDLGLICLAEPIRTELPYLDTKTHIHPDNTQDAGPGSDIVVAGRVNFADPAYPPDLGNFRSYSAPPLGAPARLRASFTSSLSL
jgi:hypothetical protein